MQNCILISKSRSAWATGILKQFLSFRVRQFKKSVDNFEIPHKKCSLFVWGRLQFLRGQVLLAMYTWPMLAYFCLERIATGKASEVHHGRELLNKHDLLGGQFLIFLPKKIKKIVN